MDNKESILYTLKKLDQEELEIENDRNNTELRDEISSIYNE